jgi:MFS family permease
MLISCVSMTHLSMLPPALPELARELGVSTATVGWLQGSAGIPGVFLPVFVGYLADRYGGRKVVFTSVFIFTLFGAAGFFATSFPMLIGLRIVQGVGASGLIGVVIALIGELFDDEEERLRALGINFAVMYMAQMVVPVVSGMVAAGGPFRPFLLFLIGVPVGLWAPRLVVGQPSDTISTPLRHVRATLDDLRRRKTGVDVLGLIGFTALAAFVNQGASFTAVPLLLDEAFGTGSAGRGLVISAFQVGAIITALGVLRTISGRNSQSVVRVAVGLMSVGQFIILLAGFPAMVSVGLAITGAGFGLVLTVAQKDALSSCSPAYRGLIVLTWVAGVRIAQVVGPPVGSYVTATVGIRSAFVITMTLTAVAAIAWGPLRRWLQRMVYP